MKQSIKTGAVIGHQRKEHAIGLPLGSCPFTGAVIDPPHLVVHEPCRVTLPQGPILPDAALCSHHHEQENEQPNSFGDQRLHLFRRKPVSRHFVLLTSGGVVNAPCCDKNSHPQIAPSVLIPRVPLDFASRFPALPETRRFSSAPTA